MGCGDSRLPLTPEELLIHTEENKLRLSSLDVAFVCTTIKKYSLNDIITDSQLLRILQRLVPDVDDHQAYKQRFFGETFFHATPRGYSCTKLSILGLLLSYGTNPEKSSELFDLLNTACAPGLSRDKVDLMVKAMVSISVVYCPLLAKSSSPVLADYKKALEAKAGSVTEAVISFVMGRSHEITKAGMTEKFMSKTLGRFLSTGGVRRTVIDFTTVGASHHRHTHPLAHSLPPPDFKAQKLCSKEASYQ